MFKAFDTHLYDAVLMLCLLLQSTKATESLPQHLRATTDEAQKLPPGA